MNVYKITQPIVDNGTKLASKTVSIVDNKTSRTIKDGNKALMLSLDALASHGLETLKNKLIKFGNLEIEPIKSEKEFDAIMDSFKRESTSRKIFRNCFTTQEDPNKYLQSLQGYWGEDDISHYINRYLATGETISQMPVGIFSTGETLDLRQDDLKIMFV